MIDLKSLIRPNILNLKPYASARHEFSGHGEIFLDANENPYESNVNRYPDPMQLEIKHRLSQIKGIDARQIFAGNGSDESIDLAIRIFCEPGKDEIMTLPPTYGMYQVSADIANIGIQRVPLNLSFQLDLDKIFSSIKSNTKIIFICSPNNPTGNLIHKKDIVRILDTFNGIVVVDEAYIDFVAGESMIEFISKYPQLIILQTLSKAWGLAGVRLGMAFANEEIIGYYNKVKAPYNINILTQQFVVNALKDENKMKAQVNEILAQRAWLINELPKYPEVIKIYPSDTNFILVKVRAADSTYRQLVTKGIVVRNRSKENGTENCLRITIGTPQENQILLNTISNIK